MPLANRLFLNSPREGFLGVDRNSQVLSLGLGHFTSTDNIVANDKNDLIRRLGADLIVDTPPAAITAILDMFTFLRTPADNDELLLVASRSLDTDALYKFDNASGLTLIGALLATGAADYDLVQFRDQVFIFDGINAPQVYDGATIATLTGTNIPSAGQYGAVFQDRLIIAVPSTNLVWFSNVLVETVFGSTDFLNLNIQYGDIITGLGVNSPTSGDKLAQEELAVFKDRSVTVFVGTLDESASEFEHRTSIIGLKSHRTIQNTPHGLMFLGVAYYAPDVGTVSEDKTVSVYLVRIGQREPIEVGAPIKPVLSELDDTDASPQLEQAVAIVDDNYYKLAVPSGASSVNNTEWWLDIRREFFETMRRWFGPHSGNESKHYALYRAALFADQGSSIDLWKIDTDTSYAYMLDGGTAREWNLVTPPLSTPDFRFLLWDAFSVDAEACGAAAAISVDFEDQDGTVTPITVTPGFSACPNSSRHKVVYRPRLRERSMKSTVRGGDGDSTAITIRGLHWRMKAVNRQGGMF